MAPVEKKYAELHLHLGGAVLPRILYTYLQRKKADRIDESGAKLASQMLRRFPSYERFEKRLTKPSTSLDQYLEAHKIVEPLQSHEALPYFINRLLRGCTIFENLAYLELRYNPYYRLPKGLSLNEARDQMQDIVSTISIAAQACSPDYPIVFTQILCLDGRLTKEVNEAILQTAFAMPNEVCAVDVAGPYSAYGEREKEILALLGKARDGGLKVTGHAFETQDGCFPKILDYLDRIGHGIQIPLRSPKLLTKVARRGQCLEVCPTSYFRTGTIRSYAELAPVFNHCFDMGIDIAICTDNSAFHGVRLPLEFERLLTHGVIDFKKMEACREAAFRHAFRWKG